MKPSKNPISDADFQDPPPVDGESTDTDARPGRPNKSALKRQMQALREMGEALARLPDSRLQELPVSDTLREAIADYQRIKPKAREGRRRQIQLIAKLMRQEDTDAISAVLESERQELRAESLGHQNIEQWRTRLLDSDETLEAFINDHALDNEFRTLARKARRERDAGKSPHAQRALFRKLHTILTESDN